MYRDKIVAGMKSIAALPNRLFTGPKALGFDPATGIITTECDPKLETTNHLMTIMGGFEIANEMMRMIDIPEWKDAWLDHAARYKKKAWELSHSRFRISRLMAYAVITCVIPKWLKKPGKICLPVWNIHLHRLSGITTLLRRSTVSISDMYEHQHE
jgi:hypothetical protein